MTIESHTCLWVLLSVIGIVPGWGRYFNCGDQVEDAHLEKVQALYRVFLTNNAAESMPKIGALDEHIAVRKSQRSPSLRLRFGRSGPVVLDEILWTHSKDPLSTNDN